MNFNKSIVSVLIFLFMWVSISSAKSANAENGTGNMDTLNSKTVEKVFQKKIYFAHQSVGKNILHGIELLAPDRVGQIVDIQELEKVDEFVPAFYHSRVGSNSDLKSKIDDFGKAIDVSFSGRLDIAFVKLCYLDIVENSDIESLFVYYKESIQALQVKYPNIVFIHLTVPLMTNNSTWKTQIKKMLGKDYLWEYVDNIKRNRYNEILLSKYVGKEPVFDLAKIESTLPDGTRESFTFKGKTYYALVDEYSHDRAHLNDLGSEVVGGALLKFLTEC